MVQVHGRKAKGDIFCHQALTMDYSALDCKYAETSDAGTLANVIYPVKIIIG
jgi:hypothetical protein